MQFRMPDAGEGLTEAEIVKWRVQPGDQVNVNDTIVEIETAKSLVEIPCPAAGVVSELLVAEGDLVPVGTPIVTIDEDAGSEAVSGGDAAAAAAKAEPGEVAGERLPVLVGYGPRTTPIRSRRRAPTPPPPATPSAPTPVFVQPIAPEPVSGPPSPLTPVPGGAFGSPAPVRPRTKPPIRKLARDLGVDLESVTPTGSGGIITRDDVVSAGAAGKAGASSGASAQSLTSALDTASGSPERETRTPVRGVRKATAEAMVASAFTAPHVTTWVTADVTRSLRLVKQANRSGRQAVSPLLLIMRAVLIAVRRHPEINASWDEAAGEIVTKHYVNLGIAAATPRGLLVPVIRDADRMSLTELSNELTRLVTTARDGSATPADLLGGTISITNIGVFGVDGGTPILPPGQSAILGVGQIARRPWVHKGKVRPRSVLQLTLSFDHRLIDGDLGSRFLATVAGLLEHPESALLHA